MPNTFAYIVLLSWPVVVIILFRALPLRPALVWSIVAGYLLLPLRTGFDFPLLPAIDKTLMVSVPAALLCLAATRRTATALRGPVTHQEVPGFEERRGRLLFLALLGVLFLTPFLTVLQNPDPVIIGGTFLPGLRPYDGFSSGLTLLVALIPFFLGRRYLASEDAQRLLLRVLALAAVAYSVLILYEVRMSPQMNTMVYGFFPHSWIQHVRGGHYRPLVFLRHGLVLAIFIASAFLSALLFWRTTRDRPETRGWLFIGIYLFGILIFCRSLGALVLGIGFAPLVLLLGSRAQSLVAACLTAVILTYPMVRASGLIPVETILEAAQSINEERARSFQTRLDNEDRLLARAQEKPLAGWGGWGRSRVYSDTGQDISTTDGYWIIVIGSRGWLGYIAQFGLLCLPTILLGLRRRRFDLTVTTTGFSLVLTVLLIDQIPNASVGPLTWLIAGSMMGRYQTARLTSEAPEASEQETSEHPGTAAVNIAANTSANTSAEAPPGDRPQVRYRRQPGTEARAGAAPSYSRRAPTPGPTDETGGRAGGQE